MVKKPSIVFITDNLAQHGAERYLYEITKVLRSAEWTVTVYVTNTLMPPFDFYANAFKNLGVQIVEKKAKKSITFKNRYLNKIAGILERKIIDKVKSKFDKEDEKILAFLKSFELVSIIKWENYIANRILYDKLPYKAIHILSTLAQYANDPFGSLPTDGTTLVIMDDAQKEEIIGSKVNLKVSFSLLPLFIDNNNWQNTYAPKGDGILRIGIFARISFDQPTIFVLFVVEQLKSLGINVELNFFGRAYDEKILSHFKSTAESLKIGGNVNFLGHTEDIGRSISDFHLDLGIMNTLNSFMGYSSIEIQSHGLPVLFFNISNSGYQNLTEPYVVNQISDLTKKIKELWNSDGALLSASEHTYKYAKKRHNIADKQVFIEEVFNEIISRKPNKINYVH